MTVDRRANASKYYDCVVHIVMHNLQHIQIKHVKKNLKHPCNTIITAVS